MKALESTVSVCSVYNFVIENYTEIFYAINKRNVQSVQYKKLRWSNLMEEVKCPSLVFIDFHIPVLRPGLCSTLWHNGK
jgi:hypothetical protein